MFETSKQMQLCSYPDTSPAGRLRWHSITQTLLIRWFHIRYLCVDSLTEQVLMTGDLEVLESINADSSFNLISVSLASPPSINGTDNWVFSPLRRVTTLIRNNVNMEELLGYEYHVDHGRVLIESFSSAIELDVTEVERTDIFIRPPFT